MILLIWYIVVEHRTGLYIAFDSLSASMMSDALKAIVELEKVDITAARRRRNSINYLLKRKVLGIKGENTQEWKAMASTRQLNSYPLGW